MHLAKHSIRTLVFAALACGTLPLFADPAQAQGFDLPVLTAPTPPAESFASGAAPGAALQGGADSASTGIYGRTNGTTQTQGVPDKRTQFTGKQNQPMNLNLTRTTQLGGVFGTVGRNGLPPTLMDSFVYEAGGAAEDIYGDEGTVDIPPYFEFTKEHRIERGITGVRREGLATGHSSFLPDAWGGDEWTGNEWDQSGNGSDTIPRYQGGLGQWASSLNQSGF
ncbi:MAG TPA: hypothetical protein V6C72_09535 [Chroococcales cyanobacterium]